MHQGEKEIGEEMCLKMKNVLEEKRDKWRREEGGKKRKASAGGSHCVTLAMC